MKVVVKDSEGKIYIYHSINELITMLNAQFDLMNFELVEENKINTRTYKVTNTGNFEVALANDGEYGYFEHNELGDESGGGLWFKDGAIYDYDGVAELPSEVVVELENRGVDIRYLKED